MLFSSYSFLLFLPLAIAALAAATWFGQRALFAALIAISLLFYGWFRVDYILILLASAAVNFYLAAQLERTANPSVFWFGVVFNIALLAIFKYADFLVWNFDVIFRQQLALPNIVLPLALSFITFEQISFLSDVRSRKAKKGDFLRYVVFVTFFPKLIAGPIIRFREMAPQLSQAGVRCKEQILTGLCIFCFGLFKKVMIADSLALVVDPTVIRLQDGLVSPLDAITALLAYSAQIYFDFSAYSEMALGIAWMLGIQLPVNFNSPYKATSIIDFWRRWHITLSSFLRDYIYFPLGGSRLGARRMAANLLIVMLIGGLWHGAAWTFVAWGFVHGVALIANHQIRQLQIVQRLGTHWAFRLGAWAASMTVVLGAWALFRSPDFATAGRWLLSTVSNADNIFATTGPSDRWLVAISTLWALLLPNLPGIFRIAADRDAIDWTAPPGIPLPPVWVSAAAAVALVTSLIGMMRNEPNAFIYFQF
jgi:alginate O-acetyltransferase complex protein AlgI